MMNMEKDFVLNYVSKLFLGDNLNTSNFEYMADSSNMSYNCGASKGVLFPENKDYVIKIPFDETVEGDPFGCAEEEEGWNYCEVEARNYEIAKDSGFSDMFAKTIFIGCSDNRPIYVQEKVKTFYDIKCYSRDEEREKTSNISTLCSDRGCSWFGFDDGVWLFDVLTYYGEERFIDFLKFLREEDMDNDLHNGNLGYIGKRPVIMDYSGYFD